MNLKIKLIEETESFPELSIGFRDFIGTGLNSGEYIVTSKKIGDFNASFNSWQLSIVSSKKNVIIIRLKILFFGSFLSVHKSIF